jgi:hypothetical protein
MLGMDKQRSQSHTLRMVNHGAIGIAQERRKAVKVGVGTEMNGYESGADVLMQRSPVHFPPFVPPA